MSSSSRPRGFRRMSTVLVVGLIGALGGVSAPAGAQPVAELPVVYSTLAAVATSVQQHGAAPAGANDWSCRSERHPDPVVLVHGTHANMIVNWNALSPLLRNNGYCVFALNYGGLRFGQIGGTADVRASAAELGDFVDRVLAATGAEKVDLVGHSQGGPLIRYYTGILNGADKVHDVVALAPTYRGSSALGLDPWVAQMRSAAPELAAQLDALDTAAMQQFHSSQFITELDALPDTQPGLRYTTIVSRYDIVATPMHAQFRHGPDARNIVIQDVCANDHSDHLALAYDRTALREVLNALDPRSAVPPDCAVPSLPYLGG